MEKVNIMAVVDDDDIYRFIIQKTIQKKSLADKTLMFANGLEALEFLQKKRDDNTELPDVILLDLNMPIMDGWQFLEEYIYLKPKMGKKITLFVVSSSVDSKDLIKASKIAEVTDFIIKPITAEKLFNALQNINID